jgi:nitroreductase
MVEVIEIIRGRRAIRKYQDKQVPRKILQRILESVRSAPSLREAQCCEIIVVKDLAKKERLRETLYKTNPARNAVVQAPVVLALCGKIESSVDYKAQSRKTDEDLFMFNLGIASQTVCLSAYALGLGTVIVGNFDHNKAKEVLELPEDYELVTLIPLGYPAEDPAGPKRREINEFIHYDRF